MLHRTVALLLALSLTVLPGLAQTSPHPSAEPDSGSTYEQAPEDPSATTETPQWETVQSEVRDHADEYVGASDGPDALYERESEVYRAGPPFRYNRVEGFVVGLRREPLRPDGDDDTRVFGQLAYAMQLRDVRYTAGVESRLYRDGPTALKLGLLYQEQTLSPDRWKTSFLENSLASVGFRHDFFDYYETEGITVYGVQDLPRTLQLTGGFRSEVHRALTVHTNWSVFGDGSFRTNPAIDAGRLQALFVDLTGGHVRDLEGLPTGHAFRLAATVGDGLGGDFSFARYEADGRAYLPVTTDTRFALRLRGGYATSGTPLQSQFTLGGIGSLRGYDQNVFRGTRTLLANAEYLIDGATIVDGLLDDLYVGGLFDAGWVGGPGTPFRLGDVRPSAGFSVGLDERALRLDVTWPLRNGPGAGSRPAIWLRITPNF